MRTRSIHRRGAERLKCARCRRNVKAGLLGVSIVLSSFTAEPDSAAKGAEAARRLIGVLDNTGSMEKPSGRFAAARDAMDAWVRALPLSPRLAVEVVATADDVHIVERVVLRTEQDRRVLLAAFDGIAIVRRSITRFQEIDRALAEIAKRDLRPDERLGFVFVTDGKSDRPRDDLSVRALGEKTIPLRNGVLAVVGGDVPVVEALGRGVKGQKAVPDRPPGVHGGRFRELLERSEIFMSTPGEVADDLAVDLFGNAARATVTLTLENPAPVSRRVSLSAAETLGLLASFDPATVIIPAGGTRVVTVLLALQADAVRAPIALMAQTPDGGVSTTTVTVALTRRSWIRCHWRLLLASLAFALLVVAAAAVAVRRSVLIGIAGGSDGIELRPGQSVPLTVFEPSVGSGVEVKRTWSGFAIRAAQGELAIAGMPAQVGAWSPYRLRQAITVNGASLVIDRITAHDNTTWNPPSSTGLSLDGLR